MILTNMRTKLLGSLLLFLLLSRPVLSQIRVSPEIHSIGYTIKPSGVSVQSLRTEQFWLNGSAFSGWPARMDSLLWLRLEMAETSGQFLYLDAHRSHSFRHRLAMYDTTGHLVAVGGCWIRNSQLSLPSNRFALRLPESSGLLVVYLQIEPLIDTHVNPFSIKVLSEAEVISQRQVLRLEGYAYQLILQGSFYGIIVILMLIALYQYSIFREQTYVFYLIYLITIVLLYLRSIEGPLGSYLTTWGPRGKILFGAETTIQYLVFGSYVFFLYHFLNLKIRQLRWVDHLFLGTGYFFYLMAIFDVIIQGVFDVSTSRGILHAVRMVFIPISFVGIFLLLIKFKSYLFWYILFGTALLLVPAAFTAFEQMTEGKLGFIHHHGFLRSFTFYDSERTINMDV